MASAPKASPSVRVSGWTGAARRWVSTAMRLGLPSEETGRPDEQHHGHDDEDHDARRFRVEHLGEALEHAEDVAGDDGPEDRAHAAHDHHGEHDDDEVRAHERADL